jgi:hypothetical protein
MVRILNMERVLKIPQFLAHLKTYGGYPIPFTQLCHVGTPDFRAVDSEHCARCLRDKLCAICGRRLGEYCYFIGGPLAKKNRLFVGPAMHKQCAEFASQTCPFLSGQKLEYSNRAAEHEDALLTKTPMAPRPDMMLIMRTYTKKIRAVTADGKVMIQAGQWNGVNVLGGS